MKQEEKLDILKKILLTDERELASDITKRLERIEHTLTTPKKLAPAVDPILQDKFNEFVKEIPATLGPTITKTLRQEIKNSQNEVVEALYPIMGQMIKRYIQNEFRLLSERIDKEAKKYSLKALWRKLSAFFSGVKESDMILQDQIKSSVEQVFIIENNSGVLLSSTSREEQIDPDLIAGMLTAIKSFVEDALNAGNQHLQHLEYDLYHIHIQQFSSFYIALVIEGGYSLNFKNKLEDDLLQLVKYKANKKTQINFSNLSTRIMSLYTS